MSSDSRKFIISLSAVAAAVIAVAIIVIGSLFSYAYEAREDYANLSIAVDQFNSANALTLSTLQSISQQLEGLDQNVVMTKEAIEHLEETTTVINSIFLEWAEERGLAASGESQK